MQAIIMAAGMGTRLGAISQEIPKPLIPVQNIPLLGHQISSLLKVLSISEIFIVTGYHAAKLEQYVQGQFQNNPRIKIIHNPNFKQGAIISLNKALPSLTEGFLVLNADHLFSSKVYEKVSRDVKTLLLGTFNNREPALDERKVVIHNNSSIQLMKQANTYHCGYTGLVAVGKQSKDAYKTALKLELEKGNIHYHPDDLIFPLSQAGLPIQLCDLSQHTFLEVDTPEDLKLAQEKIQLLLDEENNG